jgi:glycine hydroxymethyltransferase
MRRNFSGRLYNVEAYELDPATGRIDMDAVERQARACSPRMIVAGWSAYPRFLDFVRFKQIAQDVGAYLMVDMAHFAGLVAAGLHPNPVLHADVVTTTLHKTLGGPRGGMILCREEHAKRLDAAVFPGQQGGPLEHVIAAKAVALKIASSEHFRERQQRTVAGAQAIATELLAAQDPGLQVLTGGTDVHLVLIDLRHSKLDGQQAEDRLRHIGITVNRNAVPNDPRPPMISSGLRIGTAALATRGLQLGDFTQIGKIIRVALGQSFEKRLDDLSADVRRLVDRYPLYSRLAPSGGDSVPA